MQKTLIDVKFKIKWLEIINNPQDKSAVSALTEPVIMCLYTCFVRQVYVLSFLQTRCVKYDYQKKERVCTRSFNLVFRKLDLSYYKHLACRESHLEVIDASLG